MSNSSYAETPCGFGDWAESSSSSSSRQGGHGISSLGVIMVACFTVIANATFFVPICLAMRRRRRLRAQTAAARNLAETVGEGDNELAQAQTKTVRYNNIESWVVSRSVLQHDHICSKLRKAQMCSCADKGRRAMYTKKRTSTVDTEGASDEEWGLVGEETTEQSNFPSPSSLEQNHSDTMSSCSESSSRIECPICFDDMRPSDVASWSLDPSCKHVFHHACIKEWLLKHEGCPFCRATFLPIDDSEMRRSINGTTSNSSMQQVNMLLLAHNERTRSCYYCLDHGILYLPDNCPSSISNAEWKVLIERGQKRPCMEDLKKLRGNQDNEVKSNENASPADVEPRSAPSSHAETDSVFLDVGVSAFLEHDEEHEGYDIASSIVVQTENTEDQAVVVLVEEVVEQESSSNAEQNDSNDNEDEDEKEKAVKAVVHDV
eukprot:CAMPEP_0198146652 /NCGR_PEP_ID=MMETSP1443-20131203/30557_1 /TAXON_ID=186043 /ORGANISM="Entomoneis sp., Strain CCMP2396" /LENGTH=432 /DNA_ID=CAMNT_0043810687 /DNA_START=125 /DNA_END=1423 /DNA_ORIENTATION=+